MILTSASATCNNPPPASRWKGPRSAGKAPPGVALGINAKSSNAPQNPDALRQARYDLQDVARGILPKSRTAKCQRIRTKNMDVQVFKSLEHGSAHYGGLQTCGSVWTCPVCAAKIANVRRAELQSAMAMHKAAGYFVDLLTLTAPHQKTHALHDLIEWQAKALHSFWSDRQTKAVFKEMGMVGLVRALEVTHGRKDTNNGWHPHYHVLLFHGVDVPALLEIDEETREDWKDRLYEVWQRVCVKAGLGRPSYKHGIKLDPGQEASDYVSKWGLEDEMTRGHIKKSAKGETPFDFLRAYLSDPKDAQAAGLFIEFANVFKGKRQLFWSKGLKARFAVEDLSDEEAADLQEQPAELMGAISREQWGDVLATKQRGNVLKIAAGSGWHEVTRFLWLLDGARLGDEIPLDVIQEAVTLLCP